jgi:hypothetical protein
MPIRRRGNKLERWEIALVKAMVADDRWPSDQDVLAHFTRPTRSINHPAISEIRTGTKHAGVKPASPDDLESFLATWPDVDAETGLSLRGDELLIKAREAMIAAVHAFNSAGLTFRAELFIVTAIIAWTYPLHAWFRREGVDYRHTRNVNGQKAVVMTPSGAEKYWELSQCLKHARCPIEPGTRDNLTFLLGLRHEIEHRSTRRIDDAHAKDIQRLNYAVGRNLQKRRWRGMPSIGLSRRRGGGQICAQADLPARHPSAPGSNLSINRGALYPTFPR